jgi:hypothetical protein
MSLAIQPSLPPEIWLPILRQIDREVDRYSLPLTCRLWRDIMSTLGEEIKKERVLTKTKAVEWLKIKKKSAIVILTLLGKKAFFNTDDQLLIRSDINDLKFWNFSTHKRSEYPRKASDIGAAIAQLAFSPKILKFESPQDSLLDDTDWLNGASRTFNYETEDSNPQTKLVEWDVETDHKEFITPVPYFNDVREYFYDRFTKTTVIVIKTDPTKDVPNIYCYQPNESIKKITCYLPLINWLALDRIHNSVLISHHTFEDTGTLKLTRLNLNTGEQKKVVFEVLEPGLPGTLVSPLYVPTKNWVIGLMKSDMKSGKFNQTLYIFDTITGNPLRIVFTLREAEFLTAMHLDQKTGFLFCGMKNVFGYEESGLLSFRIFDLTGEPREVPSLAIDLTDEPRDPFLPAAEEFPRSYDQHLNISWIDFDSETDTMLFQYGRMIALYNREKSEKIWSLDCEGKVDRVQWDKTHDKIIVYMEDKIQIIAYRPT